MSSQTNLLHQSVEQAHGSHLCSLVPSLSLQFLTRDQDEAGITTIPLTFLFYTCRELTLVGAQPLACHGFEDAPVQ